MSGWGPQPVVVAHLPGRGGPAGGVYWVVGAFLLVPAGIVSCGGALMALMSRGGYCSPQQYNAELCADNQRMAALGWGLVITVNMVTALAALTVGIVEQRQGAPFAHGRIGSLIAIGLLWPVVLVVYAAGRGIGRVVPARRVRSGPRTGTHWLVAGGLMPLLAIGFAVALWLDEVGGECARRHQVANELIGDGPCDVPQAWELLLVLTIWALWLVTAVVGLVLGVVEGRRRRRFAHGRWVAAVVVGVCSPPAIVGYAIGYGIGRAIPAAAATRPPPAAPAPASPTDALLNNLIRARDPLQVIDAMAAPGGGHLGWDGGYYVGANPRGGVLVIGPPGSGKTSAAIIPSVIVAPGACVSTSIKDDVMTATAGVRMLRGTVWHFDPGGAPTSIAGVTTARWSPLAAVASWDDARRIASRMAEPARGSEDQAHWVDRARDWLEVLLYAARLRGEQIATVADWAHNAAADDVAHPVLAALIAAQDAGDTGAGIAARQLEGLLTIPDRERGSVLSTLTRLLRVYGSTAARAVGQDPTFDPAAFVRSQDTLFITASPDKQHEYAPLIAGLLEEIRLATYARHRAAAAGVEPARPHVTFVLDEANNTAPIPLPAIISEAGGQSLHVIVGVQDLSRARARWGKEADGFLTLFPTKMVLRGVVEPYTLDALSNAAGEYDRQMIGFSESTAYVGQYSTPIHQTNPSYSTQRQKVLHQGDIADLPDGHALIWEGARWRLIHIGMHWQHPAWGVVIDWGNWQREQAHQPATI